MTNKIKPQNSQSCPKSEILPLRSTDCFWSAYYLYTKTDRVYNSGDIPPYISHHPQEGCYFVSSLPQSLNHGAFSSDQAQPLAFCSLPPRPQVLIVTNSKRSKQTVYFVHIVYVVHHIFLFAFTLFVPSGRTESDHGIFSNSYDKTTQWFDHMLLN